MGAKVVKFSSIRSRSDEAPDISSDHIQDAQIIEIPDMPSEIRQEVSELVNDAIAKNLSVRKAMIRKIIKKLPKRSSNY